MDDFIVIYVFVYDDCSSSSVSCFTFFSDDIITGMRIFEFLDGRVSFMDAMDMSFSLSRWMSSCLLPLIPLMFVCKKVLRAIKKEN